MYTFVLYKYLDHILDFGLGQQSLKYFLSGPLQKDLWTYDRDNQYF